MHIYEYIILHTHMRITILSTKSNSEITSKIYKSNY